MAQATGVEMACALSSVGRGQRLQARSETILAGIESPASVESSSKVGSDGRRRIVEIGDADWVERVVQGLRAGAGRSGMEEQLAGAQRQTVGAANLGLDLTRACVRSEVSTVCAAGESVDSEHRITAGRDP